MSCILKDNSYVCTNRYDADGLVVDITVEGATVFTEKSKRIK